MKEIRTGQLVKHVRGQTLNADPKPNGTKFFKTHKNWNYFYCGPVEVVTDPSNHAFEIVNFKHQEDGRY